MIVRVVRDPLVHFLILGLGIFLIYGLFAPEINKADSTTIVVDRERLLAFMQYRAQSFDGDRYGLILDSLQPEQRKRLIDEYVKEEALYREAKALELDQNDYVSRRRLIQKLEFILQGVLSESEAISNQALHAYYEANRSDYRVPAKITFSHVFINAQQRGWNKSKALAEQTLERLNTAGAPFHSAVSYGDRFLYHTNYVQKEANLIASHFGQAMAEQLFALPNDDRKWRGPFRSPYGFHLAMVTERSASYIPPFEAVNDRVLQEARQAHREAKLNEAIEVIVNTYDARIDGALTRSMTPEHLAGESL